MYVQKLIGPTASFKVQMVDVEYAKKEHNVSGFQ